MGQKSSVQPIRGLTIDPKKHRSLQLLLGTIDLSLGGALTDPHPFLLYSPNEILNLIALANAIPAPEARVVVRCMERHIAVGEA